MEPQFADLLQIGWFRNLKMLKLDGSQLSDLDGDDFVSAMPCLTDLNIADNYEITDDFLKDLIKAPRSQIEAIMVNCCPEISEDVIAWAQDHGVQVTLNNSGV